MEKIVVASHNPGKLAEFAALLAPFDFAAVPQGELGVPEPEEPWFTFLENALAKARHAAAATGLPALADDSGLCVVALGGAPGVHSARYAGQPKSDARNNRKLIDSLAGVADRRAFYYCSLVLVMAPDDPHPLVGEGEWHGEVIDTPRGEGGFGYDPHVWLPAFNCTVAELDAARKNAVSHRGQAMARLAERLRARPR